MPGGDNAGLEERDWREDARQRRHGNEGRMLSGGAKMEGGCPTVVARKWMDVARRRRRLPGGWVDLAVAGVSVSRVNVGRIS
jgi:hypothetical protein